MRPADFAELLKALAIDVREYIAQALAPVTAKQAELEQRVAAIPLEKAEPGPRGASAYEIARDAGFVGSEQEWLASLRGHDGVSVQGERGERGEDGESLSLDDIAPLLREELARQVAEIPRPQDGKSVTPEELRPMLRELVDDVVLAVAPEPITLEQVREQVSLALAELPRPADGKSITVEDVQPMLRELVAALPVPADGKDGASVTLEDVRPLIDEAVRALPPAKGITIEDVQPLVAELVEKAVALIPAPAAGKDGQDGKSVTLEEVEPLLEQRVKGLQLLGPDAVDEQLAKSIASFVEQLTERFSEEPSIG